MQNPYYDTTVPIFKKMLQQLDHLLTQGATYAIENGISEQTLLDNRLAPDMFPFSKQIQIASDNAKATVARLCGIDAPVMEDTETTVAELHERIAKTIAFLDSITPEQFEGAHDRKVFIKYFPGKHMLGYDYLTEYGLPNFFFHVAIAYALLRAMGVGNGKSDFTGQLNLLND